MRFSPLESTDLHNVAMIMCCNSQDIMASERSDLAREEYLEDIVMHLSHMEAATLPDVRLIDKQREIEWSMRPYLIDFLIEVHTFFALLPETLFRTVNILDRYCSKRMVDKNQYQLLGCVSLLIAAKYGDEKHQVPHINELSAMCGGLYDDGMFIQMEIHVLNTLEWSIGCPTVDIISQLCIADDERNWEVRHVTSYLCELALYYREFVSIKPSTMARASFALARVILGQPEVQEGDTDDAVAITQFNLSRRIHQPSDTLRHKYSMQELYFAP
ncbi:cyclin-like protein [Mariannaea sp. PMI_226]|nr:cyclin-like protein [Mariannaea sp. PMI_226]